MTLGGVGYTAALVLFSFLLTAAESKLKDIRATERSFTALGVPRARFAARAVPAAEIVIAGLLVVVPFVGALAALTMLAFFTTFVAQRLRDGVVAPCACFGAASTEPLSPLKLFDNAALMIGALVALGAKVAAPALADVVFVAAAIGIILGVRRFGVRRWAAPVPPPTSS